MFTGGVSSTDEEAIDLLFGVKTPGADNLLGNDEEDKDKQPEAKKTTKNKEVVVEQPGFAPSYNPEADVDHLLGGDEPEVVEDKTAVTQKKAEPKAKETKLNDTVEVNYEAIYNDLVEQGVWQEAAIPEGTEWNKETFLTIQKLQSESQYEELLSKVGPYGKDIIEYEKNGGEVEQLLSLFREQREIQEFDITDTEGQETFLRAYLESQGNSPKSVDRIITALHDLGPEAFKEEAEEKKGLWDNSYKEAIATKKKEQSELARKFEAQQKQFHTNISEALSTDTELTPKERKEYQNYILNFTQEFQGRTVSQMYVDMAEVQKDPKNYLELAKFIKGLKTGEYKAKVAEKVKKEVKAESYIKIKNGAAVKSSVGGDLDLNSNKGSSFISLLNKKN